jgi:flagellar basal-body rod protein FlgG
MQNGYYQAVGAMVTQFNRLEHISNNLANVNTTGFKKSDVVIGDFLAIYKEARDNLPLQNHTKDAAKFLNRTIDRVPQIVERFTDYRAGTIKQTGNSLDFAMTKEGGFFVVETPTGFALTRNGSFSLDQEGTLITKQGYKVLPSRFFQSDNKQYIELDPKNGVELNRDGEFIQEGQPVAKMMIVEPKNLKELQHLGDGLFDFGDEEKVDELGTQNIVKQGFLEMSNVNAVVEMTGLIETNRLVSMYEKVMTSHMDDLNKDAITKLAAYRA